MFALPGLARFAVSLIVGGQRPSPEHRPRPLFLPSFVGPTLAFILALSALPAAAQAGDLDAYKARLPETTLFYLAWRGSDNLDQLRASNPLLRWVWSPEMKANWEALQDFYQRRAAQAEREGRAGAKPAASNLRPDDLAPFLSNPALLAWVLPPAEDPPPAKLEPALLLLYDTTGREEYIAALEARLQHPGQTRREYEVAGFRMVETLDADGKPQGYEGRLGRWLVIGSHRATTEEWLQALQQPPTRSLKDVAGYQTAAANRDPSAQLELFLNLEAGFALIERRSASSNGRPSANQLADAFGLNEWEAGMMSLAFEPGRTRYQTAFFYSPAPTSLPDVLGTPVADFRSLSFAPANSVNYSVIQLNLPGLLARLRRAAEMVIPPEHASTLAAFEGMAEGMLGVKLDTLAAAWENEFATISYPDETGRLLTVRALSLTNRDTVITALRRLPALLSGQVTMEEVAAAPSTSDTLLFHFSPQAAEEGKNEDETRSVSVAVTPDWLLLADDAGALQRALLRPAGQPSLRDNERFQQARARFPASLSSFSYADADTLLRSEAARTLVENLAQGMGSATRGDWGREHSGEQEGDQQPPTPEEAAPQFTLPLGYLKWLVTATTRDSRGLYHTGIVE